MDLLFAGGSRNAAKKSARPVSEGRVAGSLRAAASAIMLSDSSWIVRLP